MQNITTNVATTSAGAWPKRAAPGASEERQGSVVDLDV